MSNDILSQTTIILLAHSDYESLEFSLAAHGKFLPDGVKLHVLINGRGTYDTKRVLDVANRYSYLFPGKIEVVDTIEGGHPYVSIKRLLESDEFAKYKYIIKVDDDTLPLTKSWANKLCECYGKSHEKYGNKLVYVTPLVNNNGYGFSKVLEIFSLSDTYFNEFARDHVVGPSPFDSYSPYYIESKGAISTEAHGTIWRNAYISRWLHHETSLNPRKYIEMTKNLGYDVVDSRFRYSINCILFRRELWSEVNDDASFDDEHLLHKYCLHSNGVIVADLSIPMIHLFFKTQRDENRDLFAYFDVVFKEFLALQYPIKMRQDRLFEIEDRLRYIENCYLSPIWQRISVGEDRLRYFENRCLYSNMLFRLKNFLVNNLPHDSFVYRFLRRVYRTVK